MYNFPFFLLRGQFSIHDLVADSSFLIMIQLQCIRAKSCKGPSIFWNLLSAFGYTLVIKRRQAGSALPASILARAGTKSWSPLALCSPEGHRRGLQGLFNQPKSVQSLALLLTVFTRDIVIIYWLVIYVAVAFWPGTLRPHASGAVQKQNRKTVLAPKELTVRKWDKRQQMSTTNSGVGRERGANSSKYEKEWIRQLLLLKNHKNCQLSCLFSLPS